MKRDTMMETTGCCDDEDGDMLNLGSVALVIGTQLKLVLWF